MTVQSDAPTRIDLYVEKIVSYMNLDGAQRDELVRELRSHLEEAIDDAIARGIPRDHAEDEAMERFGSPEVLAGKFGRVRGWLWLFFEALGYAVIFFAVYTFLIGRMPGTERPDFITNGHVMALSIVAACLGLVIRMWNRVQVNGALRIYKFLRPTLIVPFDQITEVTLDRFHLFGTRKINLKYNGRKARYSAGWANARCVGIALEVLAPQAIAPRAAVYFRKLRLTDNQEPLALKIGLSLGWLALAIMLAMDFGPLWRGEGVSIWFAFVLLGAVTLIASQYSFHVSHAKKGITGILTAAAVIFFIPMGAQRALILSEGFGRMALLIALLLPLPVVLVWWRGRNRLMLLLVTVAWVCVAVTGFLRAPQVRRIGSHYLGSAEGDNHTGQGAWITNGHTVEPRFAALGAIPSKSELQNVLFTVDLGVREEGEALLTYDLPAGLWNLAGAGTSGPLFLRDVSAENSATHEAWTETYSLSDFGNLTPISVTTDTTTLASSQLYPHVATSPRGRYFVTTVQAGGNFSLAIHDLESDRLTTFPGFMSNMAWRWHGNDYLEALRPVRQEDGNTKPVVHEGYALYPDTGETSKTRELVLQDGYHLTNLTSDRCIVAQGNNGLMFYDLEKNAVQSLPTPAGEDFVRSWKPDINTLAYVTQQHGTGEPLLLIVSPQGILHEMLVDPVKDDKYEVASIDLSPDGKKVFAVLRREAPWFMGLGQLRVYDLERQQAHSVGRVPMIGTLLYFVAYMQSPYPKAQWTPDSRSIVWSHTQLMFSGRKAYGVGSGFFLIPYESWREKKGQEKHGTVASVRQR